jgi:hypothetical protein
MNQTIQPIDNGNAFGKDKHAIVPELSTFGLFLAGFCLTLIFFSRYVLKRS